VPIQLARIGPTQLFVPMIANFKTASPLARDNNIAVLQAQLALSNMTVREAGEALTRGAPPENLIRDDARVVVWVMKRPMVASLTQLRLAIQCVRPAFRRGNTRAIGAFRQEVESGQIYIRRQSQSNREICLDSICAQVSENRGDSCTRVQSSSNTEDSLYGTFGSVNDCGGGELPRSSGKQ